MFEKRRIRRLTKTVSRLEAALEEEERIKKILQEEHNRVYGDLNELHRMLEEQQ